MDGAETLYVIAEIAIAMAGFGGVVAGLGYRVTGAWSDLDRQRLFMIAFRSLIIVFACLVPFVLHHGGAGDLNVWRISSAVLGVAILSNLVRTLFIVFPLSPGVSRVALLLAIPALVVTCLVLAANAFGQFGDGAFAAYLLSLLLALFDVSVYFIRMIQTAFATDQ